MKSFSRAVRSTVVADGLELGLQIELLLGELQALQRIRGRELGGDRVEPLLDGVGGALASPLGLVGLDCFQVEPDGSALGSPLRQGCLVLIGHRAGLLLRCHGYSEPPCLRT